jgi:hypothetical protein
LFTNYVKKFNNNTRLVYWGPFHTFPGMTDGERVLVTRNEPTLYAEGFEVEK